MIFSFPALGQMDLELDQVLFGKTWTLCVKLSKYVWGTNLFKLLSKSRGEVLRLLSHVNKFLRMRALLMWLFLTTMVNQFKQLVSSAFRLGNLCLWKNELFGWLTWQLIFESDSIGPLCVSTTSNCQELISQLNQVHRGLESFLFSFMFSWSAVAFHSYVDWGF